MNRFVRWILASLGYLVYTAAVILVLLWWLFPAEPVRQRLVHELNGAAAGYQWRVGSLRATLPPGIELEKLQVAAKGEDAPVLLELETLHLSPDFRRLPGSKKIPLRYVIRTMDGEVRGKAELDGKTGRLTGEETFSGLNLAALSGLWRELNRPVSGLASGTCRYDMPWADPLSGTVRMNARVVDGSIGLRQPVFGLEQIDFSELGAVLRYKDRLLTLEQGRIDSKLLGGDYDGTVTLRSPLFMSEVKLTGSVEPRPELLGRLQDKTVVTLIKSQLQDNRLRFEVSGTIMEPGIRFQGASGVIDGIIQGGGR